VAFIRSRVMVALIGLIIIGGASAAAAVAMAPQPTRTALVLSGQTSVGHVATSVPTATATTRVVPVATPTHASVATPPTSELVDLQGQVFSTDTNAGTFVVSTHSSRVTVVVTSTTTFQGSATSLSSLRAGWYVQVKGTTQPSGAFLATNVEASSDN
jgi:precorrin-6x reductase